MMRLMRPIRGVVAVVAMGAMLSVVATSGPGGAVARASGEPAADPALQQARAQVQMLDDLFKVAVVDITNRYDGPPAAKVAKAIFAAAQDKNYFRARLLDATGAPQNEANVPSDAFEKKAAEAMKAGKPTYEEIIGSGTTRRLRVATVVPAVVEKCARCHGVKQGDLLGFISYDLPVR